MERSSYRCVSMNEQDKARLRCEKTEFVISFGLGMWMVVRSQDGVLSLTDTAQSTQPYG